MCIVEIAYRYKWKVASHGKLTFSHLFSNSVSEHLILLDM